jgi:hypothetical protein
MNRIGWFATVLVAYCLVAVGAARASFFDNFDYYDPGVLPPQGEWQGWDNNNPANAQSVVTAAQAFSSPNSVQVSGPDDLVHQFSGATSGQWVFSAKQYIPTGTTGETYALLMNVYNDLGPYDWASQIRFNMAEGKVYSDDLGRLGGGNLPLIMDQWVDLKWDIDLDANSLTVYYGGAVLSPAHPWSETVSGVAAVDLYANGADPVYYDNVGLAQVPEPGTLALLVAFGVLGGTCYWLRRR